MTTAEVTAHNSGLRAGVLMTDDEVLRFVNGMIVAANNPQLRAVSCAKTARKYMGNIQDMLAEQGIVATIGHAGTAVIKPFGAHR